MPSQDVCSRCFLVKLSIHVSKHSVASQRQIASLIQSFQREYVLRADDIVGLLNDLIETEDKIQSHAYMLTNVIDAAGQERQRLVLDPNVNNIMMRDIIRWEKVPPGQPNPGSMRTLPRRWSMS